MSEDRVFISAEKAISLLPQGEYVHTYLNPAAGMMLGADWSMDEAVEAINNASKIEIGGESCQSMNHALVIFRKGDHVFIEGAKGVDWSSIESDIVEGKD